MCGADLYDDAAHGQGGCGDFAWVVISLERRSAHPTTLCIVHSPLGTCTSRFSAPPLSWQDPFTSCLKLTQAHWKALALPFIERAAAKPNGISYVAWNEAEGRVEGECFKGAGDVSVLAVP